MIHIKKLYLLIIVSIAFIFLVKVFAAFISFNPQTPSLKNSLMIQNLVPQGWGFFTRSPRERLHEIYKLEHDNTKIISKVPVTISNSSSKNFFGLSRKARRIHLEMMRLLSYAGDQSTWCQKTVPLESTPLYDVNAYKNIIDSTYQYQYIKTGTYMLVSNERLPWLYYTNDISKNTNSKFIILDIQTRNNLYD